LVFCLRAGVGSCRGGSERAEPLLEEVSVLSPPAFRSCLENGTSAYLLMFLHLVELKLLSL
jgi:hypothetical protein